MWTFNVDYVTQKNSYVQLSATLCVFLPLLRDLRETSAERFVKPAVVRDFWGLKLSLPLAVHYLNTGYSARSHRRLPSLPCIAGISASYNIDYESTSHHNW